MSLIKLLFVGRSFAGAKDEASRYKLTDQTLLPKFTDTKASLPAVAAPLPLDSSPAKSLPATSSTPSVVKRAASLGESLSGWFQRKPASSKPRVVPGFVQGELSLAKVKVVRNDLIDADVVVIPVRVMGQPAEASVEQASKTSRTGAGWTQLADRVLGAARSLF